MELRQFDRSGITKFTVTDEGVKILSRGLISKYETRIDFEDIIINRIDKLNSPDTFSFGLLMVFGILFFLTLSIKVLNGTINSQWFVPTIFGVIFLFFLIKWLFSTLEYYRIPTIGRGSIDIWARKPNQKSVEKFMTYLKTHCVFILKMKYGYIDPSLPKSPQLSKLMFLKDLDIINEIEFNYLKGKLENAVYNSSSIGFNKSSE